MLIKRFLKAAFSIKNSALISAVILISYLTEYLPFMLIGLAGYLYFVMQTLKSESFKKECVEDESLDNLEKLSRECNVLYKELSDKIDRNARNRLIVILREKDEMLKYFLNYEDNLLKRKIIEQALNLVIAYGKLVYNYRVKCKGLETIGANDIISRIERNKQKLDFINDSQAADEVRKTIKMDELLLENIQEERHELERINARLDYIESAINTFKHRIISNNEEDPGVEEIESVINEASALDRVLNSNGNKNTLL